MSANPKYSLTGVEINDAEITYYSQSLTECGSVNSKAGTNPANYYADGMTDAPLTGAAQQEVATEQTDPQSLYSVMSSSEQYHNTLGQITPCKIIRNITVTESASCPYGNAALNSDSTVCTENGNSCASYCNTLDGCQVVDNPLNTTMQGWLGIFLWGLWARGQNIMGVGSGAYGTFMTIPGVNMSGGPGSIYPATIMDIRGSGEDLEVIRCSNINMADPMGVYGWGPIIYATKEEDLVCTVAGKINIPGATITMDEVPLVKNTSGGYFVEGIYWIVASGNSIRIGHNGIYPYWGNTIRFWKQYCTYPASRIDTISEAIADQCAALEGNSNCQIQDEQADNVYTYKNFKPTGLVPLATCRDFIGFYDHNICRDWWEKDRTYLCQGTSKFDFTDSMQRVNTIYKTTQQTNGLATYNDYRLDTASHTWTTEGNTFDLGVAQAQPYSSCANVCKTRKPKQDTQATQSGTPSQYRSNIMTYDFYYRQCYPSPSVCPAGAGEEIIIDCQCINEFAETFALVESLQAAGQDSICSSGVKN